MDSDLEEKLMYELAAESEDPRSIAPLYTSMGVHGLRDHGPCRLQIDNAGPFLAKMIIVTIDAYHSKWFDSIWKALAKIGVPLHIAS